MADESPPAPLAAGPTTPPLTTVYVTSTVTVTHTVTQPAATVTQTVTQPAATVTQTVTHPPQSSSRDAPWWLMALAAISLLGIVTAGAAVLRRVRQHRAVLQRERIRAAPHPDAGIVNLDRSEPALAHTFRLEPHADRGTPHLEDVP